MTTPKIPLGVAMAKTWQSIRDRQWSISLAVFSTLVVAMAFGIPIVIKWRLGFGFWTLREELAPFADGSIANFALPMMMAGFALFAAFVLLEFFRQLLALKRRGKIPRESNEGSRE